MNIVKNKRGLYNYSVLSTLECGIKLTGIESSSMKSNSFTFTESTHAFIRNGEMFLVNLSIGNEEAREIKLLLNKKEIVKMQSQLNEKGLTIVPTKIYKKKHLVKIEMALCKGLNVRDKKNVIKERDIKRDTNREIKYYI